MSWRDGPIYPFMQQVFIQQLLYANTILDIETMSMNKT